MAHLMELAPMIASKLLHWLRYGFIAAFLALGITAFCGSIAMRLSNSVFGLTTTQALHWVMAPQVTKPIPKIHA